MKYFYSLLTLFLVIQLNAQNTVTFSVDMSEYSGTYTMVNLNGNFNGWCGECAPMSDDDGDGVYELDVDLGNGTYEYKFTVDGWTDDETLTPGLPCTLTSGDFTNRIIEITGDTTIPTVCWESCSDCGTVISADITFKVDMSEYTGPAYTTVNLNGVFNGWCGGCAEMTDDNGDDIYELTVNILTGTIEYKFTLDGWTNQEEFTEGTPCTTTIDGFTNRTFEVTQDTEMNAVCWNECQACGASSLVELSSEAFSIFPNPSEGVVQIRSGSSQLNDFDLLTVYSLSGKIVKSERLTAGNNDILDLSNLDKGVYMLELSSEKFFAVESIIIK